MYAVKREGWLAHKPGTIPDPESTKPKEWDDKDD